MYYVVIDPCQDYPLYMMRFLAHHGLQAIAVFTDEPSWHAWRAMFAPMLEGHVADEFLATQYPSVEALADQIRHDVGDEIHGIIPWAELTIEFGAALGAALELDWNPPEVIHRFRNKFAMKEALRADGGVRVNASAQVSNMAEVYAFLERLPDWPVVVKPSEGAGSRGVFFAASLPELEHALAEVFEQGDGAVLLEEYVGGREYVVNGVTDANGRMLVTDCWCYDKRDVGPYRNLYHQTIQVHSDDPVWLRLATYATQVIHALELRKAPVHMELKLDERGPCLIEVGARFAGGNQPLLASELHGRSLFELAASHYLGDLPVRWDDVDYDRYDSRHARIVSGVQTVHLPRISHIVGVEEVTKLPSFYAIGKLLPVGAPAPVTTDVMTRSYEVYLIHEDPEQVAHDAERVRALIHYL